MNLLERIFKRKTNYQRENYKVVKQKLGESQEAVYKAVALINKPCNAREVAAFMGRDSASITPRLAELVKKDRVRVIDTKIGLDRKWRKYYVTVKS